ncbi:hypothetical protein [Microvirga calopogonii]|uniref:hypothetical protein n=1 Tax=Microvirga calopogonii TaxID=2078013 RepID=UPI000E0DE54D|nr:hypothetical protein [Microvirga calopogonii]
MPVNKMGLTDHHPGRNAPKGMITDKDLKILWVARTLTNIDFQYGEDVLHLNHSNIDAEQKRYIGAQLLLKYRERREPYQKLLESLRA